MNSICNVASRIRKKREKLSWSQEYLAHKAKVDRKTVSRIESGQYNAYWRTILTILAALGIEQCEECTDCRKRSEKNK